MADALALRGEEGRGKLRKASGRCKQPSIRRYPNGETHPVEDRISRLGGKLTQRTETSKYLEEKKTIVIPQVVASERGLAQTDFVTAKSGLIGLQHGLWKSSRIFLES